MTRIKTVFWVLCLGLTALWLVADPVIAGHHPFTQVQQSFIQYTGILAMGAMSVAMLLALRSVAVEPYVGGLDKSYRLHKWLGVLALVMAVGHWLWIEAPPWLRALGLMSAPARSGGRTPPRAPQSAGLMHMLQGPARGVGQWCFWAAVVLIVLALWRWFPYRWFLRTHRLISIAFLVLVFHAVVLLKPTYWTSPVSYTIVALMAFGAAASIYILFRKVGHTRQAVGKVESITPHQGGGILAVAICLEDRWPGHDAGQFAFVDFKDGEGPHPFTISSGWKDDGRLVFLIKGLGDYTRKLASVLRSSALVTIEGPYGQFNFNGSHAHQIWVSAGIGITPFVSRLQQMAANPDGKVVDFIHVTAARNHDEVKRLRELADSANVALHVWVAKEQGRLTPQHIRDMVPEWRESDVWFCGPVEFGDDVRRDFFDAGLPHGSFHQELFHLR